MNSRSIFTYTVYIFENNLEHQLIYQQTIIHSKQANQSQIDTIHFRLEDLSGE